MKGKIAYYKGNVIAITTRSDKGAPEGATQLWEIVLNVNKHASFSQVQSCLEDYSKHPLEAVEKQINEGTLNDLEFRPLSITDVEAVPEQILMSDLRGYHIGMEDGDPSPLLYRGKPTLNFSIKIRENTSYGKPNGHRSDEQFFTSVDFRYIPYGEPSPTSAHREMLKKMFEGQLVQCRLPEVLAYLKERAFKGIYTSLHQDAQRMIKQMTVLSDDMKNKLQSLEKKG